MQTSPTVSVVIPAPNDAENLPLVLPLIPDSVFEVILVDGPPRTKAARAARWQVRLTAESPEYPLGARGRPQSAECLPEAPSVAP